ncbi:MAG: hypothetical protein DRJ63_04350 [Thermoprotei archaeon]|nr:MAG: hypothetical protein DRJ63_04350 [Thermoprotei archaeon]
MLVKFERKPNVSQTIYDIGKFKVWEVLLSNSFLKLKSNSFEKAIAVLSGKIELKVDNSKYPLTDRSLAYIPLGTESEIYAEEAVVVVAEAEAVNKHKFYFKHIGSMKKKLVGERSYLRYVYTAIGPEDPSDHFLAGFTEGYPGNWTSFPPHKHDEKPEVYVYYGMGRYYGVQFIEENGVFKAFKVYDYDAVIIEKGYHPNVALPFTGINYFWIIYVPENIPRELKVKTHPLFEK